MLICDIKIEYYIACFVGSVALYAKTFSENKQPLRVLININQEWEKSTIVNFIDAILFCIMGTLIGTWICQPTNIAQSVSAGLGWTGILSTVPKASKYGGDKNE